MPEPLASDMKHVDRNKSMVCNPACLLQVDHRVPAWSAWSLVSRISFRKPLAGELRRRIFYQKVAIGARSSNLPGADGE